MVEAAVKVSAAFPATKLVTVDPTSIDDDVILQHVVPVLQAGQLVALPTETVYGLAGNALDAAAAARIFQAKGRPSDNPLIVHISHMNQLQRLVAPHALPQPGSLIQTLCDRFWPGPLTIVFPKHQQVPMNVTAGLDHVAIRMPSHPVARRIIDLSGLPLAAPSANRSGRPSPTSADHVLHDLGRTREITEEDEQRAFEFGRGTGVGCIVDGGECSVGVESTVVRAEDFQVLRPGTVTLEQLRQIDDRFELYGATRNVHKNERSAEEQAQIDTPSTPGLKYTHYAPSVPLILFEVISPASAFTARITSYIQEQIRKNPSIRIGLIRVHQDLQYSELPQENLEYFPLGSSTDLAAVARGLFASFRALDEKKVDLIVMEGVLENFEGLAVMNRARKAAQTVVEGENGTA